MMDAMMEEAVFMEALGVNPDLLKNAAEVMAEAYAEHDTMIPAIQDVGMAYPQLSQDQLVSLWFGAWAKNQKVESELERELEEEPGLEPEIEF